MRPSYKMEESPFQIDEVIEKKSFEKYVNFYYLLDFWMQILEQGKTISTFFKGRGYSKIAVYGKGALGKHLIEQLKHEQTPILYTTNKNIIFYLDGEYEMQTEINKLPKPDVIVVTPIMEYESIQNKLKDLLDENVDIVSLEEVILSL